ncbi:hypothetical protein ACFOLJ_23260 [Rugamonas sp. CCM 8940]|uniref:hypothetical protein n=1 Tax=Rugamonas sp. CCM 8940 TaxID=2765359 RepID=UPI0018F56E97|nr:hypothetical protein [Rugamonas sp. CCM 8940]MBJ7312430.1 hypothetical protein [Rugamonas sp. CCM 8940]
MMDVRQKPALVNRKLLFSKQKLLTGNASGVVIIVFSSYDENSVAAPVAARDFLGATLSSPATTLALSKELR